MSCLEIHKQLILYLSSYVLLTADLLSRRTVYAHDVCVKAEELTSVRLSISVIFLSFRMKIAVSIIYTRNKILLYITIFFASLSKNVYISFRLEYYVRLELK